MFTLQNLNTIDNEFSNIFAWIAVILSSIPIVNYMLPDLEIEGSWLYYSISTLFGVLIFGIVARYLILIWYMVLKHKAKNAGDKALVTELKKNGRAGMHSTLLFSILCITTNLNFI